MLIYVLPSQEWLLIFHGFSILGLAYYILVEILVELPYSWYNLRGAIFANHQISHLAVIFAIVKFANHFMYRVTFRVARRLSMFPL